MLEIELCCDSELADISKRDDANKIYLFRTITEEFEVKLNT